MQASKVTVTQETRAKLDSPILNATKRRDLRRRLIIDYIRGHKNAKFKKQHLIAAAGLDPTARTMSYNNGLALVNSMIKSGLISCNNTTARYKRWAIPGDDNRTHTKSAPVVTPTPEEVAKTVVPKAVVVALQDYETVDRVKLVDMAKEFSWRENSDSLREFITYVENAIK